MKRVMITLLFLLTLLVPHMGYSQIVQGNRVVSSTSNCATTSQTTGNTAYGSVNNNGQNCVVAAATANSSGLTVVDMVTTTSSAASVNIVATPGQIYGLTVDSVGGTSGTVVWLNFFNAVTGSVTPGTTSALFSYPVVAMPTTSATDFIKTVIPWGTAIGVPFSTALSVNCTTTKNGASQTGNPCHVLLLRK